MNVHYRLIVTFLASEKDIDIAVAAARKAFKTTWGKNVTGTERARLINKLADLMERDVQILADLESIDNGKPMRVARLIYSHLQKARVSSKDVISRDMDIGDSIACLRYYAGWADKIVGQVRVTLADNSAEKLEFGPSRLSKLIIKRSLH